MRGKKGSSFLKIFLMFVVMVVTSCSAAWAQDSVLFAPTASQPTGVASNGAIKVSNTGLTASTTIYAVPTAVADDITIRFAIDNSMFPSNSNLTVETGPASNWTAAFVTDSKTEIVLTSKNKADGLIDDEEVAIIVKAWVGGNSIITKDLTLTVNVETIDLSTLAMENVDLKIGINYTANKALTETFITSSKKALGSKHMVFKVGVDGTAKSGAYKLWKDTGVIANLAADKAGSGNFCGLTFSSETKRLQGKPHTADITVSLSDDDAATLLVLDDSNAIVAGVKPGEELATVKVETSYFKDFTMVIEDIDLAASRDIKSANYAPQFSKTGTICNMPELDSLYFEGDENPTTVEWNGLTLTLDKDAGVLTLTGVPQVEETKDFTVKATSPDGEVSNAVFAITVGAREPEASDGDGDGDGNVDGNDDEGTVSGGSSSGGCDAGFGAAGLLVAGAFVALLKRGKK